MKDLRFIPGVSAKQMYDMNMTLLPKDSSNIIRTWYHKMDRNYNAEYKGGIIGVHTRSIDTCFGRMIHAAISFQQDNATTATDIGNNVVMTWSDIQMVKDNVIDYDRFAVEVYPKRDNLVDMANVYHIFAFDDMVKNPFNIKKNFTELNEGIYLPNAIVNGWLENSYSANQYSENKTFPYRIDDKTYMVNKEYRFAGDMNNPQMQMLGVLTTVTVYVGLIEVEILKRKQKVYHVIIQPKNGYEDMIVWNVKQMIKDMIFGPEYCGIEIYPTDRDNVDDGHYHMFVFEKEVDIPFGIHPNEEKYIKTVNRGPYGLNQAEFEELHDMYKRHGLSE